MRILIPILGFSAGGGYRVLSQFATEWVRKGHNVDFLVPSTRCTPYYPTQAGILAVEQDGRENEGHLPAYRRFIPHGGDNILRLYLGMNRYGASYDVILANHSLTSWPARFANVGGASRFYYIQAYEPEFYSLEGRWRSWLLSKLSYHLGLKHIVNAPLYREYKNIRADYVAPPGIDLDTFHPKGAPKASLSEDVITIGTIGRTEPSKGLKYVLEAFEKLYARDKRFRLNIAFGNLPHGWRHKAASVTVPRNDEELACYYRGVDILISAGIVQHGAIHYPVLEGMACRTPVVTTDYFPADASNSWPIVHKDSDAICSAILEIAALGLDSEEVATRTSRGLNDIQAFSWEQAANTMLSNVRHLRSEG